MKKFIHTLPIVVGVMLLFYACNESQELPTDCDKTVIVSKSEFKNAPNDPFKINKLEIIGDCLKITFSSNGCDGTSWKVKLIDAGIVAESYPVQRTLRLSLENKEMCGVNIVKEISVDIRKLQIEEYDKIWLSVSEKGILYEY
ncbi:MAG: hypothetical protein GX102_02550 [Porphyromonadaceae bacterium]|jgi:hypothetical protein|nr:hypothetical protein [Porphyromonadaceae bacterium]